MISKKHLAAIAALLILIGALLPCAAYAEEGTFEVTATELDGVGDDENGDGMVFLFEGSSKSDRIVSSEEHNLRYMYILVFDRYGSCVQLGNNLVFESVDRSFQNYVVIPKGGFMVAFYYNDSAQKNRALFDYYKSLENVLSGKPEEIYNRTLAIESDYTASLKKMTVTLTYGSEGSMIRDCTSTDPDGKGGEESDLEPPPEDVPAGAAVVPVLYADRSCSCVDGEVVVIHNEASVEEEFLSDEWNFRYMHVMAFDRDGKCVQSGNNLVQASVDKSFQNGVKVPGGGFIVAFFYNASEAPKNRPLFDLYDSANGNAPVYNATVRPLYEIRAREEGNYLVMWMPKEDPPVAESSDEPVSGDDSSADGSEPASESSGDEPSEPDEASPDPAVNPSQPDEASPDPAVNPSQPASGTESEPGSAETSGQPVESAEPFLPNPSGETSRPAEADGGLPVPVIVLLCAAGAAVIAAFVLVFAVKQKDKNKKA